MAALISARWGSKPGKARSAGDTASSTSQNQTSKPATQARNDTGIASKRAGDERGWATLRMEPIYLWRRRGRIDCEES